jgi:hypothetical protein
MPLKHSAGLPTVSSPSNNCCSAALRTNQSNPQVHHVSKVVSAPGQRLPSQKPCSSGAFNLTTYRRYASQQMYVTQRGIKGVGAKSKLKFVAHANGRVNVGRLDVAASQSVMHPTIHRADISVEVLVEAVVGVQGKSFEPSAANGMRGR